MHELLFGKNAPPRVRALVESLPVTVRAHLRTALALRYPIIIFWSPDLVQIYNDAYRVILGDKHPRALGQPARECWAEIWDRIAPLLDTVLSTGEAVRAENLLLPMSRRGFVEETYFTFSYGPLEDDAGRLGGVFCTVHETTAGIIGSRRLAVLRELAEVASPATERGAGALTRVLSRHRDDIPFWLLYRLDRGGEPVLVAEAGVRSIPPPARLGFDERLRVVEDVVAAWGLDVEGDARRALLVPLRPSQGEPPLGYWVAGTSARLPFDDEYRSFLTVAANDLASMLGAERATAAATAHRERLEALIREAPLPIALLHGPELRFEYANDRYDALVGHRDLLGKTVAEAFPDVDHAPIQAILDGVVQRGELHRDREVSISLSRDGHAETIHLDVVYQPLRDSTGAVEGVLIAGQDMTEEVRSREILAESERRFRELADAVPHVVWTTDPTGHIDYTNRHYDDLFGAAAAGRSSHSSWMTLMHADDLPKAIEASRLAMGAGVPFEYEARLGARHGDGHRRYLIRALPVRGRDGTVAGWVGSATDIEDQKRSEDLLREADRAKDTFLATLAHELRNPLAAIHNAVQILRLGSPTAAKSDWIHGMLDRQVRQVVRLVDDLLDVSRITHGKLVLRREMLDLGEALGRAVETNRPLVQSRRHEFSVSVPRRPMPVWGDAARLAQAISNVIANASLYTEPGGRVTVTVDTSEASAEIRVADTGAGIAPEMLSTIFDPFVQADASVDRAHGGLGIGLALARRLLELHGGSIEARSEGLGRGSEFVIRLPLADGEIAGPPPIERPERTRAPRHVLVVDDNRDSAESLARLLDLLGHEVEVAHDGRGALDVAARWLPDLVVLDIGLPGLTGYDVAPALRSIDGLHDVTIVALSGYGSEEDRRRSRQSGFDAHLLKPVDLDALKTLLERIAVSEEPRPPRTTERAPAQTTAR